MSIFTVRILNIISVIRVIISPINICRSGIVVWIPSHLHATVKLACVLSAQFACTDTCWRAWACKSVFKSVVPVLWFMSHQQIDRRSLKSHRPHFPPPPCFHLLYQEFVLFFRELSFSVSFSVKAFAAEKLRKKCLWTSLPVRIWSQL